MEVLVVDKVEENKETLFGKLSSTSTKDKSCDEVAVASCNVTQTLLCTH